MVKFYHVGFSAGVKIDIIVLEVSKKITNFVT